MSDPDVTYFILDYNPRCDKKASRYLECCLSSLYFNRSRNISNEVYVIDQGNQDPCYKRILSDRCYEFDFNYIGLTHNKGIAGGINLAARINRSKYLCLVTSDTVFPQYLDEILIEELEKYPSIHQITPAVDRGDVPYQVQGYTTNTEEPIRCISHELTIQMWKRNAFRDVGYWDERWIACYENLDYALRLFITGYDAAITHRISCHHEHGTTNKNGSLAEAYGGQFDHTPLRRMWDQKWPGLNWDMMYDLKQYTEKNRLLLYNKFAENIRL